MATRLRNYSRAWYFKFIAWILVLACSSGIVTSLWHGLTVYEDFPYMAEENYIESQEFRYEIGDYATNLIQKLLYENMDKKYTKELVDAQMQNAYQLWKEERGYIVFNFHNEYDEYYISTQYTEEYYDSEPDQGMTYYDEYGNVYQADGSESSTSVFVDENSGNKTETSDSFSYEAFEKANPNLRSYIQQCMEQNLKYRYENSKDFIAKNTMFQASVIAKDQKREWKKMFQEYQTFPFYILYQNGKEVVKGNEKKDQTTNVHYFGTREQMVYSSNGVDDFEYVQLVRPSLPFDDIDFGEQLQSMQDVDQIYDTWIVTELENLFERYQIGIGIDQTTLAEKQSAIVLSKSASKNILFASGIMAVILLFSVIYLIAITGKSPRDNEVHLNLLDSIWSEIQGIAGFLLIVGGIGGFALTLPSYYTRNNVLVKESQFLDTFGHPISEIIIGLGTMVFTFLIGSLILSQVRRLKARNWLEGFICIRIIKSLWRKLAGGLGTLWRGGRLMNRMAVIAIVVPILSATWIGVPFMIAGLLYLVYRYVPDFEKLQSGVKNIKDGNLSYQIQIEHEGVIKEVAKDVNTISEGLKKAIASEVRSERMKAELISNVSHDIKTPLTSIITYVDLLKKEEIDNETAKDYIAIIENKAHRLKVLTNDLFEAAKASSGDMPVHLEKVNIQSLVQQSLGEFDDKLKQAGLTMRVTMPENPLYILADGRLMWRVASNLLSNVVKYAQTGSRVYLDVEEEENGNWVHITMKNISAYELNIDAEELMERFTRGDESRSTEGSGLGLNIANSLIALQHGEFEVSIDGDLFKVIVKMPRFHENAEQKREETRNTEEYKDKEEKISLKKERDKEENRSEQEVFTEETELDAEWEREPVEDINSEAVNDKIE